MIELTVNMPHKSGKGAAIATKSVATGNAAFSLAVSTGAPEALSQALGAAPPRHGLADTGKTLPRERVHARSEKAAKDADTDDSGDQTDDQHDAPPPWMAISSMALPAEPLTAPAASPAQATKAAAIVAEAAPRVDLTPALLVTFDSGASPLAADGAAQSTGLPSAKRPAAENALVPAPELDGGQPQAPRVAAPVKTNSATESQIAELPSSADQSITATSEAAVRQRTDGALSITLPTLKSTPPVTVQPNAQPSSGRPIAFAAPVGKAADASLGSVVEILASPDRPVAPVSTDAPTWTVARIAAPVATQADITSIAALSTRFDAVATQPVTTPLSPVVGTEIGAPGDRPTPSILTAPLIATTPSGAPVVAIDMPVSIKADAPASVTALAPAAGPMIAPVLASPLTAPAISRAAKFEPVKPLPLAGDDQASSNAVGVAAAPTGAIAPAIAVTGAQTANGAPLNLAHDHGLQRMIDHIEALRDDANAHDTRIRLTPDALGTVDVSLRKQGDAVHVHFTAERHAAQVAIAEAQPRLTELASARGVRLAGTSVDGGALGSNSNGARGNATPAPAAALPARPASAGVRADATDTLSSPDQRLA